MHVTNMHKDYYSISCIQSEDYYYYRTSDLIIQQLPQSCTTGSHTLFTNTNEEVWYITLQCESKATFNLFSKYDQLQRLCFTIYGYTIKYVGTRDCFHSVIILLLEIQQQYSICCLNLLFITELILILIKKMVNASCELKIKLNKLLKRKPRLTCVLSEPMVVDVFRTLKGWPLKPADTSPPSFLAGLCTTLINCDWPKEPQK